MAQSPSPLVDEADNPEATKARALVEGADLLVAAGDREDALTAYRNALAIYETLSVADPRNTKWRQNLAVCHNRIGGRSEDAGDCMGALAAYRKAFAIIEKLVADDPDKVEWQHNLSITQSRIGSMLAVGGDHKGALAAYRKAFAITAKLVTNDPDNAGWQHNLSVTQSRIGSMLAVDGNHKGALAAYRKALAIFEKLANLDSGNAEQQRNLSVSHAKIGDILADGSDHRGALAAYRKAFAIIEQLVADDPGNASWQRDLSAIHERIGDMLAATGDGEGALAAYRVSFVISEKLVAADPENTTWHREFLFIRAKLGGALLKGDVWRRQNSDLVLKKTIYDDPVPGAITAPDRGREPLVKARDISGTSKLRPASDAEKEFEPMPDTGPTKQEILQLTADRLAQALAQYSGTSTEDAKAIVDAVRVNAPAMIGAAKSALRPKKKFISKDDLTDAELNDPNVIGEAIAFAKANRQTRVAALGEAEANKLRRARLIEKYDLDRRQRKFAPA